MEYDAESYGEAWADDYDDFYGEQLRADTDTAVTFLAGIAREGRALELGVGTGRIAIPLAERGVEVHGIDASEPMLERLRDKPGSEHVHIAVGDFADVAVGGDPFDLVYVVANTIFVLTDQDTQVRCLANVARRLAPGGAFVIEAFVPDLARFDAGQTVRAINVDADAVSLEVSRHDRTAQTVLSQHLAITEQGIRLRPTVLRYCWPSELDLMARLAGLTLRDRWADWNHAPFTSTSGRHISVYASLDDDGGVPA
jgi:SAM-dependent methyltransferase